MNLTLCFSLAVFFCALVLPANVQAKELPERSSSKVAVKSRVPAKVRTVRAAKKTAAKPKIKAKNKTAARRKSTRSRSAKLVRVRPETSSAASPRVIVRRDRPLKSYVTAGFSPSGSLVIDDYASLLALAEHDSSIADQHGNIFYLTTDPALQQRAKSLLEEFRVPWGAIVAMDPRSGRILALAGHSAVDPAQEDMAIRAGFPAASLFKVITAAAAVERSGMNAETVIRYRGGAYTLNQSNYRPDTRRDQKTIELATALGKSCNPAFGRVALRSLSPQLLELYAESFLFNRSIPFELPLGRSTFATPQSDYELARTAAGFGEALLSPVHAAMIAGAMANGGMIMQPYLVDSVVAPDGLVKYHAHSRVLKRAVLDSTASKVLDMMQATVDHGTARKHFQRTRSTHLRAMRVAGKTGTLRGKNPEGVYHWFIAAAPVEDPQIAIAALVVDPGYARIGGTGLGVRFMESFFAAPPPARQYVQRAGRYGPG